MYNNNRPNFYGNQNNNIYRPQGQGQNIYQQMNMNYKPPQSPYQNNYNPNNNNNNYNPNQNRYNPQQNYQNNQQNQNQGIQPFIEGFIGRCKISSEDLQTFSKSIKEVEWTSNANYMQANNIPVRHKLMGQGQNRNDVYQPMNRFNNFYENFNYDPSEMLGFIAQVSEKNNKFKEEVNSEKSNFMKNNFPSENADLALNDLYQKIEEKRKDILIKDSNLYQKVERLLPLIKKVE